jgi:dTDP-4-amino-4,6-dideoxygalactose transaminase
MKRIYLSPHLDGSEKDLLMQAYDSNWISTLGLHVGAFEREMVEREMVIGIEFF